MQTVDQIIIPKWLIPVDPSLSVLENHALVINNGTIADIIANQSIESVYRTNSVVKLESHALIPGLVNAHTHAAMSLLRGYADDLPLMQWLSDYIWPVEAKWVDKDFVACGTDLACAEMIRSGTTCFNDMYFFPDIVSESAEHAGMRACIGMIVVDFPTVWAEDADEYINKGLAFRDEYRHSPLITAAFAPHAPYTVSDGPLEKIATLSEELDCPIHMHVHETQHEIEESNARYGMRPLERLDQLGLLNPHLIAVHMTQLLPGEIETVAERGVNVVHCPESNMKLASGFCPISKLDAAGVNVAIGTDGASSNNDLDMLGEIQTASLLAKGISNDPTAINAYQAIQAATINGAKALGLDQLIGSIEIGKQADIVAIDLSHAATQPVYHPVNQIVYSASREQVSDVWIAGKHVLENTQLTTLDMAKINYETSQWRDKINS